MGTNETPVCTNLELPMDYKHSDETDPVIWWNTNWIFLYAMIQASDGGADNYYLVRYRLSKRPKKERNNPASKAWRVYKEKLIHDLAGLKQTVQ